MRQNVTDYSKFIAVTNRHLCRPASPSDNNSFSCDSPYYFSYLSQIEKIAEQRVHAIVLREKDLSEYDYELLASDCIAICKKYDTKLILHNYIRAAWNLNHPYIHLPLHILLQAHLTADDNMPSLNWFKIIGTSTHSVKDALDAEKLGADYIFCGNIYETDCKAGLAGKGLDFLSNVCKKTNLPVYAIGGINTDRLNDVIAAGAAGACMMSGFMKL